MRTRFRGWIRVASWSAGALALGICARQATAQTFTLADAAAAVVSETRGVEGSSPTVGWDAAGRAVLVSDGTHTIGYRYAPDGKILEHVDESGNRASYEYTGGFVTKERVQPAGHAPWVGSFVADQNGKVFAQAVEKEGASDLSSRLMALGAEPWTEEHQLPAQPDEPDTRVVDSSFAQRTIYRNENGSAAMPGGAEALFAQTTTGPAWSGGGAGAPRLSMTITQHEVPEGYLLRDDWGGSVLLTYDDNGEVASSSDADGFVVKFGRDDKSRLTDVALGDDWLLRYVYDEDGEWSKKQVVDLLTGAVYFEAHRAAGDDTKGNIHRGSVLPRTSSRVALGDSGAIVEWDDRVCPNGCLVATVGTEPYALIPLESPPEVGAVIETSDPTVGSTVLHSLPLSEGERVDYAEKRIWLHLEVERAGVTGSEPTTVLVELDRAGGASSGGGDKAFRSRSGRNRRHQIANKECRQPGPKVLRCGTIAGQYTCWEETLVCSPPPPVWQPPQLPTSPTTPPPPRPTGPRDRDRGERLSAADTRKVDDAKRLARAKLTNPRCAALFNNPNYSRHNPFLTIDLSSYWNGNGVLGEGGGRPCATQGRPAWTFPNSLHVEVCLAGFGGISERERAVVIIHEALHSAGQYEVDRASDGRHIRDPLTYPLNSEISQWVRDACDLN